MLIWGFAKVLFNIYGKKNLKLFNEGVDFLRDEDYEKALIIFKKLYDENFEINEVLIKLCFIYKELGDYKTSLKYINEYLILNPNSGRGLKYKNEIFVKMGCYEDSLEISDMIIKLNDENLNFARLYKAKALMELDRHVEALNLLESIEFNEDEKIDPVLWEIKGNDYFYLHQYRKSIDCYFTALDLGLDEYDSFFNIGNAYAQLEEYENALIYYDKALGLNEYDKDLWYNKSMSLFNLERYDDALFCINKALDLDNNNFLLYNKAGILFKLNNFNESLEIYENLLEEMPNDIDLLIKISAVFYELKSFEDILKYSDMVLSIDDLNEEALFYKFLALKCLNKYEIALECVNELLSKNSVNEEYISEKKELLKLIEK